MAEPILTLTTDFGLADHYVGVMKGAILAICPRARIVDISHQVTPFAIAEGAYLIAQSYRWFPEKTVHVAVVDPGVGSERRAILVEAAGQYFVGPDNGIFTMVMAREKHKARVITNDSYFHWPASRTFQGRDVFAPVGAHLAAGVRAASMGKIFAGIMLTDLERPQVLHIDRFGNIVTNLPGDDLYTQRVSLEIAGTKISRVAEHYAEMAQGRLFLIEGSSGYIEVSMNLGSAAERIGCRAGAPVRVRKFY
jgi:S-adenosyl-L-methionine hydrolase (adenosine-forming)